MGSFLNPCVCLPASINVDNDRVSVAPYYSHANSCIKKPPLLHAYMRAPASVPLQHFSFIRAKRYFVC